MRNRARLKKEPRGDSTASHAVGIGALGSIRRARSSAPRRSCRIPWRLAHGHAGSDKAPALRRLASGLKGDIGARSPLAFNKHQEARPTAAPQQRRGLTSSHPCRRRRICSICSATRAGLPIGRRVLINVSECSPLSRANRKTSRPASPQADMAVACSSAL